MILYRYELVCGEEDQNIGFMRGLKDVGIPEKQYDKLLRAFEMHLAVPDKNHYDLANTKFYFTKKGVNKFRKNIIRIHTTLHEYWWSLKEIKINIDINSDKIKYMDKYQVAIREFD